MQETDDYKELEELKNTLDTVERIPEFNNDGFDHNIVKRQVEEDDIKEESSATEIEEDDLNEEGRGWKKKGKDKRNKKNKSKKKLKLKDLIDEIDNEDEEEEINENKSETQLDAKESEILKQDPYTNGIQFSAYSGNPQPNYKPQPQTLRPKNENKFLYSMDYQGNAQYMDEAAVSVLLKSPQAMKVRFYSCNTHNLDKRIKLNFRP